MAETVYAHYNLPNGEEAAGKLAYPQDNTYSRLSYPEKADHALSGPKEDPDTELSYRDGPDPELPDSHKALCHSGTSLLVRTKCYMNQRNTKELHPGLPLIATLVRYGRGWAWSAAAWTCNRLVTQFIAAVRAGLEGHERSP